MIEYKKGSIWIYSRNATTNNYVIILKDGAIGMGDGTRLGSSFVGDYIEHAFLECNFTRDYSKKNSEKVHYYTLEPIGRLSPLWFANGTLQLLSADRQAEFDAALKSAFERFKQEEHARRVAFKNVCEGISKWPV